VSDSSGLIDFATGLVISALNLLERQEKSWGNPNYRRISTGNHSLFLFICRLVEMTFRLGHATTCSYMYMFSLPKWHAVKLTYLRDRMSRPLTKFKDPNLPKLHYF